jgi:pimeloyl-ACP methyl ester carboxylesterase
MTSARIASLLCCVLGSIGCSSAGSSDIPPPAANVPSAPSEPSAPPAAVEPPVVGEPPLSWKACVLEPAIDGPGTGSAECALTDAPRDYAQPEAGRIELGVKRVVQSGAPKAQLWLVDGGPGASAVAGLATLARRIRTLRPDIELYAVDHRGVGGSHALTCPETDGQLDWPSCITHLQAKEADYLPHITTSNAMRDLARLVERTRKPNVPVYVYGGSYGTYAVLRYMALFPKQADAVILEGISPPGRGFDTYDAEMNGAAQELFAACAKDPSCASRLGANPWKKAGDVIASFDAGHCPTLNLDSDGARSFLGAYSLFREFRDLLPAIVYRMERCEPRDVAAIVRFYQALRGGGQRLPAMTFNDRAHDNSYALFFHIALSEMWHWDGHPPLASVVASWRTTTMSTGLTVQLANLQSTWPVYTRGPEVTADLPAFDRPLLMLQGGLDTATTAAPARRLRDHYKGANQTWVEVPSAGHMVMEGTPIPGNDDCGRKVVLGFLDDPNAAVDTSCISQVVPPLFDGVPALNQILLGVSDAWDG